ncbi:MAG TPA: EMC3/TMCO1 family protein [Candidatus Norongarragalinales archaeon]|jgi:uncharacterized membrane protein (DUF106 family)|nr:EMC3/TMCO1 family protein [Candidatus Norongarragalinales archaeon]
MILEVLSFLPDWLVIFLLAGIFGVVSLEVNKRWGGRQRVKAIQKQMKEFQKEMQEAQKSHDEAKMKELAARDHDMTQMMQDMMLAPLKGMILIIPLFLVFVSIAPWLFPNFSIHLPLALHVNEIFALKILQGSTYGARGFFILSGVVWGFVLETIQSKIDEKQQQKTATETKV